ncbi:MAG: alpha/beta fold hydrolase [Alphaproteobacteria bacterium]|nr:alpha/beta fold hydrolase [Alphaproteobacteria bacterium]
MPDDPSPRSLGPVATKHFETHDFRLTGGGVLPVARLAYETYGRLAPDGRNAVLLTHGFTSSHHAAGRNPENGGAPGWWDGHVGPGKAIDTDRLFVVSSNMLGSSYGSTSGASIDPVTGKPYGPTFPDISVSDIVRLQRLLLDALGVKHLVAVAGQSYGGFQAFQWAVDFPDFMDAIVPTVTAPKSPRISYPELHGRLAADPGWNGGWYYGTDGVIGTMRAIREETLKRYGMEEVLKDQGLDAAARDARIKELADAWSKKFDAHALLILRKAADRFDVTADLAKIRAKVLYVIARTDVLFPPSLKDTVMPALKAAGVDARYFEIDTEYGHTAAGNAWNKWTHVMRDFLAPLIPR